MATVEKNGLLTYKDKSGNKYLLYPITKIECIDGLEDELAQHLKLTGGTMTGNIIMSNGSTVTGLPDPEEREDAVSFGYLKRRYGMGVTTFQSLVQGGTF